MNISINGEPFETDADNLATILEKFGAQPPYAVALNGDFVAKSDYQQTTLSSGDLLDVVSPIFGG